MSVAAFTRVQRIGDASINHPAHVGLTRILPWSAVLLVSMALAAGAQPRGATADAKAAEKTPTAAQPAVKPPTARRPDTGLVPAKGSWYISTNTTASNWSKTGLFYEKPWDDHVDAGDNTTLELYVKALTPHTIEVFNDKKLGIGMVVRPDAAHPKPSCDLRLGDYVQLKDQSWTKVSIPLADFKGVNPHDVYFFPGLPQAFGTGNYSLGVDEVRFVGGSVPVVWYGDAHPNNPIAIHGPGMEAHFVASGGLEMDGTAPKK